MNEAMIMMEKNDRLLRSIYRGELAAVEAYTKLILKYSKHPNIFHLKNYRRDHRYAAQYWKSQMQMPNKTSSLSSGFWGIITSSVVALSQSLGRIIGISVLRKGEEYGLQLYQGMLKKKNFSPEQKKYIQTILVPSQRHHIIRLTKIVST